MHSSSPTHTAAHQHTYTAVCLHTHTPSLCNAHIPTGTAYTHTCTHTYTHTCSPLIAHTQPTQIHLQTHTHEQHTHTYTLTDILHTHTHAHPTHTHTFYTRTNSHTYTRAAYTHLHTHSTHAHIRSMFLSRCVGVYTPTHLHTHTRWRPCTVNHKCRQRSCMQCTDWESQLFPAPAYPPSAVTVFVWTSTHNPCTDCVWAPYTTASLPIATTHLGYLCFFYRMFTWYLWVLFVCLPTIFVSYVYRFNT